MGEIGLKELLISLLSVQVRPGAPFLFKPFARAISPRFLCWRVGLSAGFYPMAGLR